MSDQMLAESEELTRWRDRYASLVRQLEQDAAAHAKAGDVLRRLVQRLCLAARGLGDRLDQVLDQVSAAMRGPGTPAELEPLLAVLSNAIATAESPAVQTAQAHNGAATDELRCALGRVIERIEFEDTLQERAREIRAGLDGSPGMPAVVEACCSLSELVDAQRERLRLEKADVQRILVQVDTRLHEFVAYLRGEESERRQADQSRTQLDDGLLVEVRGLTEHVRQASDLVQLREQVGRGLEAVDRQLQAFRARETERNEQHRHRSERMRARVEQLEHEARALQASLQREQVNASTDFLTGIPNRLALQQRVALEYKRWKRFGRPLSIAVWDIDHFKSVNDTHGHRLGDRVIRSIARLLASQVRETDFVARYGGEEFVALLVDASAAEAMIASEKLRRTIEALKVEVDDGLLQISASCGIAEFRSDDTPDEVFERADRALFAAKQGGRNRCARG